MSIIDSFSTAVVQSSPVSSDHPAISQLAINLTSAKNEQINLKPFLLSTVASGSALSTHPATDPPVPTGSRFYQAVVDIKNFIQNWGPNHLILQCGPQIKHPATGIDFKFTPTLVLASDHVEGYLWHTEVGTVIPMGSDYVNGYALGVNQQGIEFNWCDRTLSYNRQQLGRVELDIPYGKSGLQFTVAVELGMTSKTRTLFRSLQHAVQDTITQVPAATLLLTRAYHQLGIIGSIIGLLSIPSVMDKIVEWAIPGGNERDNYLWFGLSIGYADYNGNVAPNLNEYDDPSLPGVNILATSYLRHGEAMSYDFQTKKVTLPYGIRKILGNSYQSSADFIKNALHSRDLLSRDLVQSHKNGKITAEVKDFIIDIADEIILKASSGVEVRQNIQSKAEIDEIDNAFSFIEDEIVKFEINQFSVEKIAQEIARRKQCYVVLNKEGEVRIVIDRNGNHTEESLIESGFGVIVIGADSIVEMTSSLIVNEFAMTKGYSNYDLLNTLEIAVN